MDFTSCSVSCRNNKACSLLACVIRREGDLKVYHAIKYDATHFFRSIKGESNVTMHLMRILLNDYVSYRPIYFCHYLTLLTHIVIYMLFITTSRKCYSGKFLENKITIQNKLLPRTAFGFLFRIFHYFFIS